VEATFKTGFTVNTMVATLIMISIS